MSDIKQKLIDLFDPEMAEEQCGLISADGQLLPVDNIHSEPSKGFRMDSSQVLELMQAEDIVGAWHTHPHGDAALSQEDYAGFLHWPDLTHYIVGNGMVESYEVRHGLVIRQ